MSVSSGAYTCTRLRPFSFAVAGHVGRLHRLFEGHLGPGEMHQPDARRRRIGLALPQEPEILRRIAEAFGNGLGLIQRAVGHQGGEFVPAEPDEQIAGAHYCPQHVRHAAEQPVSGGMSVGVVDYLELVEIEKDQRMGFG